MKIAATLIDLSRRCPHIGLSPLAPALREVDPYVPGLITDRDAGGSVDDALHGGAMRHALVMHAAHNGTVLARRRWYALRRRMAKLASYADRDGYSIAWGQPAPGGIALHIYILRDSRQIVGSGDVSWIGPRVDVLYRRMLRARRSPLQP